MSDETPSKKLIRLSAKAFVEAIQGKTVKCENGVDHCFAIGDGNDIESVIIENVEVAETVLIEERCFNYSISIVKCLFQDFLIRRNTLFDFQIESGSFHHLWLQENTIQNFFILGGNYHILIIDSGSFTGDFAVKGGEFQGGVSVKGGEFNSFGLENGLFNGVNISGGTFENNLSINGGVFENGLSITGGTYRNGLRIWKGKFNTFFSVFGGSFLGEFTIVGGDFDRFSITGFANLRSLNIHGGSFKTMELVFDRGHLDIFQLLSRSPINYPINIVGQVSKILFKTRLTLHGSIYINKVIVRYLWIRSFINEGKLDVNQLQSSGKNNGFISIKNSDLGNAIFKETDFRSFQTIHVSNSRLHNITTIGGYFPSHLDIGSTQNNPSEPERSAEAYNQLTLAMQKQGNRDKEVEYYTSYLDWQRKAYLKSKKWSAAGSLWLHKVSTEYGSSWIRGALLTLLVVSPACYFLYSLTLPGVCCQFFQVGWQSGVWLHVKYFLTFLLPTHSLDFVQGIKLGWGSYALDIFGRIAIGFMIYQTIAAFRRYGKV